MYATLGKMLDVEPHRGQGKTVSLSLHPVASRSSARVLSVVESIKCGRRTAMNPLFPTAGGCLPGIAALLCRSCRLCLVLSAVCLKDRPATDSPRVCSSTIAPIRILRVYSHKGEKSGSAFMYEPCTQRIKLCLHTRRRTPEQFRLHAAESTEHEHVGQQGKAESAVCCSCRTEHVQH